jgi:glycosyltransferase involved in cell wall biosynthesis
MRLAVDARVLVHRPTGVARYLAGVLGALRDAASGPLRLELIVDRPPDGELPGPPDAVHVARWPLPGGDPAWRQLRVPACLARLGADLLFAPFYSVPLAARTPSVVTIHDVAFLARPEWFDWRGRLAFRLAGPSAHRARRVLTVSEFSAGEIARRLRVPASKIDVTLLAVDDGWREPPSEERRRAMRAWLGFDGPYLLHLGAVHERRLPDVLVRAFARGAPAEARLVVAGPTIEPCPDVARAAHELGLGERLVRREWVPEEHLRALVADATLVAYLSLYEGFGLPALEALAAGAPVVALRRASLPELLGDAATWVEQPDERPIAAALDALFRDDAARADLARAGRDRSARFTWSATASGTWAVLRNALATPSVTRVGGS